MRKITITAIDVAEWRGLDDQQVYPGHEAARRAFPDGPLTNYATSCAKGANCANRSNWATPIRGDARPSYATNYPRRGGARRLQIVPPCYPLL